MEHYIDTLLKKPGAIRNSLALKQAPVILQTIFKDYFSTNPKQFLEFLIKSNAFKDLDLIVVELGLIKKRPDYRVNPKYLGGNGSLNDVCINQLNEAAILFGQKGENKR